MHKIFLEKFSSLFAYTALICSVLAIAEEVPFPSLVFFGAAFIAGLVLDRSAIQKAVPLFYIIILLIIPGIIVSLIGMSSENLFERMLSILLLIISAKLLAPKKPRDMLQLFLLNMLLVVAAAVTRWGMEFALLVILEAFISVTGLIFTYASIEKREITTQHAKYLVTWSSLITLGLIPLTAVLFLVIPRPTETFFAWGGRTAAKSGFSDQVSPGAVEEIKNDFSPAFRVTWLRGIRPQRPLWRGIVYDTYHDGIWKKEYQGRLESPRMDKETIQYEILLEPNVSRYLLNLGLPFRVTSKTTKTYLVAGYTARIPISIMKRILYRTVSYYIRDFPADLSPDHYLKVPEELRHRLRSLTQSMNMETHDETARAVESFLKTEFAYDLSPGEARGDPVLFFLFNRKRGHCEYFASAMVLMLRSMGVPSRIVGGYLGGEWNELGQYYLVRQSDAHTWVEVWIDGRGWATFDPTPRVFSTGESRLKESISEFFDFLRLRWYYWVLDYDIGRQRDLARKTASLFRSLKTGDENIKLAVKRGLLKTVISVLIVAGLIVGFIKVKTRIRNRPRTLGERFVHIFGRHGYVKRPGETLKEFATRITEYNAFVGLKTMNFVEEDYRFEYGQSGRRVSLDRMLKDLENDLKRTRGHAPSIGRST